MVPEDKYREEENQTEPDTKPDVIIKSSKYLQYKILYLIQDI